MFDDHCIKYSYIKTKDKNIRFNPDTAKIKLERERQILITDTIEIDLSSITGYGIFDGNPSAESINVISMHSNVAERLCIMNTIMNVGGVQYYTE